MDLSRQHLASVRNYEEFFTLCQSLAKCQPEQVYDFVLPVALSNEQDQAQVIAGRILIELEPRCRDACRELLLTIARSNWDLSLREVPFYLVAQFGKWNLLREINEFVVSPGLSQEQRVRVEGIGYWASFPASELTKPFHYWEWQEVIERKDA